MWYIQLSFSNTNRLAAQKFFYLISRFLAIISCQRIISYPHVYTERN
jgi:hypothetical protein